MDAFDPETFETKFRIADIASRLYMEGDGDFLIKDIAAEMDIDPAEVFNYFPNKQEILKFYYASLVARYEGMIDEIEDFESYTLSEKLSNFAYTTFDMLGEREAFVKETFEDLVIGSYCNTVFENEVERLIKKFIENDPQISMSSSAVVQNSYFYGFLRRQYLELLRFWINDSSEGRELSMELTDKLATFLQELLYNAILDKGFELAKFLAANRKAFFCNLPIIKQICSKIEIR